MADAGCDPNQRINDGVCRHIHTQGDVNPEIGVWKVGVAVDDAYQTSHGWQIGVKAKQPLIQLLAMKEKSRTGLLW